MCVGTAPVVLCCFTHIFCPPLISLLTRFIVEWAPCWHVPAPVRFSLKLASNMSMWLQLNCWSLTIEGQKLQKEQVKCNKLVRVTHTHTASEPQWLMYVFEGCSKGRVFNSNWVKLCPVAGPRGTVLSGHGFVVCLVGVDVLSLCDLVWTRWCGVGQQYARATLLIGLLVGFYC